MTQEQIKDHVLEYIELNANEYTGLQIANKLIENTSNILFESGYINAGNQLTTCYLIIKDLLEKEIQ